MKKSWKGGICPRNTVQLQREQTDIPHSWRVATASYGTWMIGVRKSHCHVFLEGLDPGQAPPKTLLLMLRLT